MPIDRGIAGRVAKSGASLRAGDASTSPLFNPEVDRATGFKTRSVLRVPIASRRGGVFAVAQLLSKRRGGVFDERDEERFREFTRALAPILEAWVQMGNVAARRAELRRGDVLQMRNSQPPEG